MSQPSYIYTYVLSPFQPPENSTLPLDGCFTGKVPTTSYHRRNSKEHYRFQFCKWFHPTKMSFLFPDFQLTTKVGGACASAGGLPNWPFLYSSSITSFIKVKPICSNFVVSVMMREVVLQHQNGLKYHYTNQLGILDLKG